MLKACGLVFIVAIGWLRVEGFLLAQTNAASLQAALKGKRMALRSYSADAVTNYALVADALVIDPIKTRGVSLFTVTSSSLNGHMLTI